MRKFSCFVKCRINSPLTEKMFRVRNFSRVFCHKLKFHSKSTDTVVAGFILN